MKTLIIDNNDSFTMNLAEYVFQICGSVPEVVNYKNINDSDFSEYTHIIISPGPGLPEDFRENFQMLSKYASTKKILGVCMGMQIIAAFFGDKLRNLDSPLHGAASDIFLQNEDVLFRNINFPCKVGRYHSWVIDSGTLPECLRVTAALQDGTIMSVTHKNLNIRGVQFHPESIITVEGKKMLRNWLL